MKLWRQAPFAKKTFWVLVLVLIWVWASNFGLGGETVSPPTAKKQTSIFLAFLNCQTIGSFQENMTCTVWIALHYSSFGPEAPSFEDFCPNMESLSKCRMEVQDPPFQVRENRNVCVFGVRDSSTLAVVLPPECKMAKFASRCRTSLRSRLRFKKSPVIAVAVRRHTQDPPPPKRQFACYPSKFGGETLQILLL